MSEHPAITQIERAVESFLLDREAANCTSATMLWYTKYIGALAVWLSDQGLTHLNAITPDHLRAYVISVRQQGFAPKTQHHHASAARAFFNFLVAEGLISEADNPARRLKMPKVPKDLLPALDVGEVEALLDACTNERDRALILFLVDSGLRCAECVKLNLGDLDMRSGAVFVRRGKGQKSRTAYIGLRTRKALTKYLLAREDAQPEAPLWISRTNQRLTDAGIRQLLQRVGEAAGVHTHPHKLRRTFAIWALRSGMDIVRLAQLLGHSDLQVVKQYLAIVENDLATAHREHGPVDTQMLAEKRRGRNR